MHSTAAVTHSNPHRTTRHLLAAHLHSVVHLLPPNIRNEWVANDNGRRVCSHAVASTPPQRRLHEAHRSRQPPSSTTSLQAVLDQKLRKCSSIQQLLSQLHDSSHIINAVNVFTATTKTHALLRHVVAQQSHSRRTYRENHTDIISQIAALQSVVEILIHHTAQQERNLSSKHCVSILTAHAWIKRLVCNSPVLQEHSHQLLLLYHSTDAQQVFATLCGRLASNESVTKSADLSRAVWASVTLGHIHRGLAETASRAILQRCTAVIQDSEPLIQGTGKAISQQPALHQPTVSLRQDEHAIGENELTPAVEQLSDFANLVHVMGRAVSSVQMPADLATPSNIHSDDGSINSLAEHSQDAATLLISKQITAQAGDITVTACHQLLQQSLLLVKQGLLQCLTPQDAALLLDGTTRLLQHRSNEHVSMQHAEQLPDVVLAVTNYIRGLCIQDDSEQPVSVHIATIFVTALACMCQTCMQTAQSAATVHAITAASEAAVTLVDTATAKLSRITKEVLNNTSNKDAQVVERRIPLSLQSSDEVIRHLTNMLCSLCDIHRISSNVSKTSTEISMTMQTIAIGKLLSMTCKMMVDNPNLVSSLDLCKYAQAAAFLNKFMDEEYVRLIRTSAIQLDQLLLQQAADMQSDRLVTLLWSLVRLGITPVTGLGVFTARLRIAAVEAGEQLDTPVDKLAGLLPSRLDLVDDIQPCNVSRLCWAFAKCDLSCLGKERGWVLQQIEQAASVHAPDMDNQSLVTTLWALTALKHPCSDFLAAAAPLLQHRISLAGQPSKAETQIKQPLDHQRQHQSEQATNDTASINFQNQPLTAQQLSVCLWSAARAVSTPDVVLHGTGPLSLLTTAAPIAASMVPQLSGQGLAMIAVAYASAQVQPGKALLHALSSEAVKRRQQLDVAALSMIAWALSHFVLRDQAILLPLADELHEQLLAKHLNQGSGTKQGSGTNRIVVSEEISLPTSSSSQQADVAMTTAVSSPQQSQQVSAPAFSIPQSSPAKLKQRPNRDSHRPADIAPETDGKPDLTADTLDCMPVAVSPTVIKSVVSLMVSLAKAGLNHPGLMQLAVQMFTQQLAYENDDPNPNQSRIVVEVGPQSMRGNDMIKEVVCCLWSLSKSGQCCDGASLHAMISYIETRLLHVAAIDQTRIKEKWHKLVGNDNLYIDPRLLCILLQSLPALRYQPSTLSLDAACNMLSGRVSSMSSHNICEVIWALAALQYTPPQQLLSEMISALEQRVLISRQELLTLHSTLKLAWGLAYFRQYKTKLARHAIARSLCCSPDSFLDRPSDQRMLLEVKLLCEGEARAGGFWRAISVKWKDRIERGAPEKMSAAMAVQGQCDQAEYAALSRVSQEVVSHLASLGYHDAKWHASPQGEVVCTFLAVPTPEAHTALSNVIGIRSQTNNKEKTYTIMQSSRASPAVRMAIVLLCSWHYSSDADRDGKRTILWNAALHERMLVKRGFRVVFIDLKEWDSISYSSIHARQLHQQQLLQQALNCYKPSVSGAVQHFH